jgi:hypothetical protein
MNVNSQNLFRAIRGPIILITVGVLFALDHLTPFSFWRTWPVILIVVGLLSLGEHLGPRPNQPPSRREPDFRGDQQ